ncbi:MAG: Ig-like domain-containing protein [Lachnospiraceae bacterium]|nr:Ig-like domain-containing protein [Lachnospiraceae bacterium]
MKNWCKKGATFLFVCFVIMLLLGNQYVYAATATPVDTTNEAFDAMISKGKKGAIAYLHREYPETYSYGYEWILYTMVSSGAEVSQVQINSYYNSVAKEIKTWDGTEKPTDAERVALTLSILGKDIADVEGVNLAAMIYNSSKLASGSNELVYALLALDAKQTAIPEDAKWSRDEIIQELLKFQNGNGGFGLSDNTSASVDMTAMALQALAPYKADAKVSASVGKALDYLKNQQSTDCGFGSPEATTQVWIALSALGVDAIDASSGFSDVNNNFITYLNTFYIENPSGYVHALGKTNPDSMTTMQVLQAFTAYEKYQNGEGSYWDLTTIKTGDLVKPTFISFEKEHDTLYATQEVQLAITCSEEDDSIIQYTSANEKVATISDTGLLTGVRKGTTEITAISASGATATITITVKTPAVRLSTRNGKLQVNKSTNALRVVQKLDTDKVVKWTSSDKRVVTVNEKGKLTAKKVGKATITVTMKSGAIAKCKVTVQKKSVKSTIKFKKKTYKLCVKEILQTSCKLSNSFDVIRSYKSSDKKIVKVTKQGVLKGVKPGTAKITVTTKNGAKADVKVIVKKK